MAEMEEAAETAEAGETAAQEVRPLSFSTQPKQTKPKQTNTFNPGSVTVNIIIFLLPQPGSTTTLTSTISGLPVTSLISAAPSTITTTLTSTQGATATALPGGAVVVSNTTVPVVVEGNGTGTSNFTLNSGVNGTTNAGLNGTAGHSNGTCISKRGKGKGMPKRVKRAQVQLSY